MHPRSRNGRPPVGADRGNGVTPKHYMIASVLLFADLCLLFLIVYVGAFIHPM